MPQQAGCMVFARNEIKGVTPPGHYLKHNDATPPPLKGGGGGGDGVECGERTHPHPSLPLEGEGTIALHDFFGERKYVNLCSIWCFYAYGSAMRVCLGRCEFIRTQS